MKSYKFYLMILAVFMMASFTTKAESAENATSLVLNTVVDIIVNSPVHNTLEAAVVAAGLDDDLQGAGPFTVFAPTDAAFAALPEGTLDALLADPTGALTDVLLYHVVAAKKMSSDLTHGQYIKSVLGENLTVVVLNGKVYINNSLVTVADLVADNGVVHVIDAVLLPPASIPATVADIISNSSNHTDLDFLLNAAGLVDDLQGAGPFTVFAPTDAAFAALPEGILEDLLNDPAGALTDILLYHVVAAKAMSSDLSNGQKIKTMLGKNVTITISAEGVFVNNAKVTVADLVAENGVVHVIDAVLAPGADVKIVETASKGKVITDGDGRTLYFFARDAKGASLCTGGCLNNWPVFYTQKIITGPGLNPTDFGSIDRGGGVMQTTYKGWPLYYFVNDKQPGNMNGDGVIGKWFVAKPDYTIMITDNQLTGLNGLNYKGDYTPGDEVIQYFTDEKGLTLYTRKIDKFNTNTFTKSDFSNNGVWPIYEESEIVIPSVLNKSDFGVINVYGKNQLTYKGWPLYYFGQDMMVRGNNKGVSVPTPGTWPVPVKDMKSPKYSTVVNIIVNSPVHNTLEAAVVSAGLADDLSGTGPFTVFAPTDAAFAALPAGTLEALLKDIPALTNILTYHVVGAKAMSSSLTNGQKIVTLQGKEVIVTINDKGVFINNAKVTVVDLEADNGVVHVIDAVLIPAEKAAFPIDFETKTDAVWEVFANGAGSADDFMVIPNPDKTGNNTSDNVLKFKVNNGADPWAGAFSDTYAPVEFTKNSHIVTMMVWKSVISPVGFKLEGSTNGGPVTEVKVSNTKTNQWEKITFDLSSVIGYSYNRIVIFPDFPATRTSGTTVYIDNIEKVNTMPATVVDIIVNSADHNTLEAAVVAAGLADDLAGTGPFTVFAPTDAAFAALPAGTLEALLKDIPALTNILTYHVVGAKAMSSSLTNGQKIVTLQGTSVTVTINNDGVFINNAKVTVADLEAENGVVHVIDAVLIPTTTSISTLDGITVDIYPNPASDYIRINSNVEVEKLMIRDIAGRVVNQMNNVNSNERIDISGFKTGIYVVTMQNGNSVISRKLIKR